MRRTAPARRALQSVGRALPGTAATIDIVVASVIVGLVAGHAAHLLGPAVLFAVPIAGIGALLVLDRIELAPCLVVLALPFGLVSLPGGLDATQAVALAVIGLVALRRTAGRRVPLVFPRVLWWGVGVAVLAFLSTPGSLDLDAALRQDFSIVLALLLVSAVVSACTDMDDVRRVVMVLAFTGGLVCLYGLQGVAGLQAVNGGQTVNNRVRGTFTDPNQFGVFSGMVLLACLGLLLAAQTRRERWLGAFGALASFAALAVSLSRGAWIGAVLGVALVLYLLPRAWRPLATGMVPLAGLALAFGVLQPDQRALSVIVTRVSTLGDVSGNPYDSRPALWAEGRRQVVDSPVLGQGPGQFPAESVRSVSETATVYAAHAHNVLLNAAAELGLVAAALMVGFTLSMLVLVRRLVRRMPSSDAPLVAGVAGALAVVVGQGLVDFTLRNAVILAFLCLLVGLVLAAARAPDAAPVPPADARLP